MTKDLGKLWAERMTMSERDTSFPDSEPRDAATLMLIDRSGPTPRVLLGRRHAGHKFMPGKFVFPGGRIEALDQQMTAVSELHPDAQKNLLERVEKPDTEFARAVTPPRRPRRFDTRFLTADASAIAHTIEGVVGPDSELVELTWVPIEEAAHLDMPTITAIVLEELLARVEAGMGHGLPVPYYYMIDQQFFRELL